MGLCFPAVRLLFPHLAVTLQPKSRNQERNGIVQLFIPICNMDTLAVIIIACLVTIVILVLIVRNTILSNKITDTTVEYDRLKRENDSLEKECKELVDALNKTTYQNH
jgi:uncharacterized membrane protein (DUF106 family)